MRALKRVFCILGSVILLQTAVFADAKIDPALSSFAKQESAKKKIRVLAILNLPHKKTRPPQRYNQREVMSYLQDQAMKSRQELERDLSKFNASEDDLSIVRFFWINNSLAVDVTPSGLLSLASTDTVKKIYANANVQYVRPYRQAPGHGGFTDDQSLPYDYAETGLDKLMAEMPKITGEGVVLGSVDTGVDGKHSTFSGKILNFYNGQTHSRGEPIDTASHGTHTAGTMVGGDHKSDMIGMAPGAKLIAAGALIDYDTVLKGMEWMLDPDGNRSTNDSPRAINNSWNCSGAPDVELFYRAIAAWEAAGILPVFSAGNAGPSKGSITPPHEYPGVIAVGATAADGKITDYSSRGPGVFKGKEIEKPDLTAPGDNIRSSVPGGRYAEMSGTSMAAPHVTGAVGLLLQVDPKLNPTQLRSILLKTVTPVDEEHHPTNPGIWNKVYGFGKLNIYEAVKLASTVSRARVALENGEFERAFFQTPETLALRELLASPKPMVDEDFDYPASFDGPGWLTRDQIF